MKQKKIKARVERISPLTDTIVQLILKPDKYVDYQAGQYLQIILGDEPLSYSIANAPLGSHQYELHIRHSRNNLSNQTLFAELKREGAVTLLLPFGECSMEHLDKTRPIVFIAGGTGFAPVKAMIEQLLTTDDPRAFELYWSVRSQSDLYWDEQVKQWETHVERFQYCASLSEETKEELSALVRQKHPEDLNQWQIVIAGPFDMAYSIRDALVAQGVSEDQIYSDAFSFKPKRDG